MTRLKYYQTRAGARIAMRSRNHRLGFLTRVSRIDNDPFEYELCLTTDGQELTGTYSILEDTIDTVDILVYNDSDNDNNNNQHAGG